MPFLENIVGFINDTLKAGSLKDKRFQAGSFNKLTTIVAKQRQSGPLAFYPGVVDNEGNYKTVEPDDKFPFVVYHKVLSNTYDYQKTDSYGDNNEIKSLTDIAMIVWADCKKLKLSASQLEAQFLMGMPQRLSKDLTGQLMLSRCTFTPVSSNMDQLSVFRQEYQNVDYFLKPQHAFFIIRYKAEMVFNQACFDACGCN